MGNNQSRKIRVMRIVSRLNMGGPSIHMKILTEGLDRNRFETKLLVGCLSEHEGDMSYLITSTNECVKYIPHLQREIHAIKDLLAFWGIFKAIFKIKPDIVHTHMAKAGAIGRGAVVLYNLLFHRRIISIHTYHGNVLEGYFNLALSYIFLMIERILAKFTDAIIAISQTQKWELIQKYRISKSNRVHVINLGFNLKPFLNLESLKGEFKKRLGVEDSCVVIGIVGRLVPIKNHKMFLDAAKVFIYQNKGLDIRFVLVGDGELKTQLGSYAGQIGILDNVIFWGWERDIRMVYCGLDILALTSNNEGTPVSIIEAMASGVPVITTGVGGVKDLLGSFEKDQKGKIGFKVCERGVLCHKNDPEGFAKGLQYILKNRNESGKERIKRSQSYVLENYSEAGLIQEIEKLYERLTKESNSTYSSKHQYSQL